MSNDYNLVKVKGYITTPAHSVALGSDLFGLLFQHSFCIPQQLECLYIWHLIPTQSFPWQYTSVLDSHMPQSVTWESNIKDLLLPEWVFFQWY